jgi:uncharacterized flavoprotein (TIGR03862 family)
MIDALVIGAGPAGLMAAEALAAAGRKVVVAEAKPSPARKFLMAGKSGLNITKAEAETQFAEAFHADWLRPILAGFGPDAVQDWCRALGQEVFTGSSGRVFPVAMKASPLLRAWLARLSAAGVELRRGWRWEGFAPEGLAFRHAGGAATLHPAVTVLALGGASWSRLGSDGAWAPWLTAKGVEIAPFQPANMGFEMAWSPHMTRHFGSPVKGAALCLDNGVRERGEFVISARGLEGGGIYALSRALREGARLTLDLFPDLDAETLANRLGKARGGDTLATRLRKLGLAPAAIALVMEWAARPLPALSALPALLKALPVPLGPPRPMDEAISVAGGIRHEALTQDLELRALPGVFACGEMLDWEAPTGGFLLTGCLATGQWAGRAAARFGA